MGQLGFVGEPRDQYKVLGEWGRAEPPAWDGQRNNSAPSPIVFFPLPPTSDLGTLGPLGSQTAPRSNV